MRLVSPTDFLSWAAEQGIGPDERYPHSESLAYHPYNNFDRFWLSPCPPSQITHLLTTIFRFVVPDAYIWVYPRAGGTWYNRSDVFVERMQDRLLFTAGVPEGFTGAVQIDRSCFIDVCTVALSSLLFGWSTEQDFYFIPDHARQIVMTSHHDVLHVSFREEPTLNTFVASMEEEGWPLPTEVPDETFKSPAWMQSPPA